MLRSTFSQLTLTEIDPDAIRLDAAAIERILHKRLEELATLEDFAGFYHDAEGVDSSDPMQLFVLLVLQYRYGDSDREVERRAVRDLGWRYAMRLGSEGKAPSRPVLQRFRTWVREKLGEDFVHDRVLLLGQRESLALRVRPPIGTP